MKYQVCNCNRSMTVDADRLGAALDAPVAAHHALCRSQLPQFAAAVKGNEALTVACTEQQVLFATVAQRLDANRGQAIRFVNLRETAGWTRDTRDITPKMAALLADAAVPDPTPRPAVAYVSQGRLLIVGAARMVLPWADELTRALDVTALITDVDASVSLGSTRYAVVSGTLAALTGWLGGFTARWNQINPVDLEICVRCNACVDACPEGAIGAGYQVDAALCRGHRDCVAACGALNAIDFGRSAVAREGRFDLVLDLQAPGWYARTTPRLHPPLGYFAPGADSAAQAHAALECRDLIGEFEKPRYVDVEAGLCAHARSGVVACTRCIDVCSTQAISAEGDRVRVEAHVCIGCGACATTCPSGAMRYAAPTMPELSARLQAMTSAWWRAGGDAPVLLVHDESARALILELGAAARAGALRGLPANVLPVEITHVASFGLEAMLAAIAHGAAQVVMLTTEATALDYRSTLEEQIGIANAIVRGIGFAREGVALGHARDVVALEGLASAAAGLGPLVTGSAVALQARKRSSLGLIIGDLHRRSPRAQEPAFDIELAAGAPFGGMLVDAAKCTLCMSCVGACPAQALATGAEEPLLRFFESNCIQCGLCVNTCPEQAIRLQPRLRIGVNRTSSEVVARSQAYACVRCGKPFGAARLIETMVARLETHSMFADNAERLRMCADCRVIETMSRADQSVIGDQPVGKPQ